MAGQAENGREQSLKQQTGTYLANFFDGAKEAVGQYLSNIGRELRAEIRADREAMRADMAELRAATEILARDRVGLLELKTMIETRLAAVRDGEPGPAGPEGPPGPQGEVGKAGPAGADGSEWHLHGLFEPHANYSRGSVVVLDGGAFVAIKDDAGPCPGDGWRQLVQRGKSGLRGEPGERGPAGPAGPEGKPGKTVVKLKMLPGYHVVNIYDDGSQGEPFSLRDAFAQYDAEKNS